MQKLAPFVPNKGQYTEYSLVRGSFLDILNPGMWVRGVGGVAALVLMQAAAAIDLTSPLTVRPVAFACGGQRGAIAPTLRSFGVLICRARPVCVASLRSPRLSMAGLDDGDNSLLSDEGFQEYMKGAPQRLRQHLREGSLDEEGRIFTKKLIIELEQQQVY